VLVLAASMHWLLPWGSAAASPAVEWTAAQANAPDVEERIARVEHGLLPPVLVKGEPTPRMTLAARLAYCRQDTAAMARPLEAPAAALRPLAAQAGTVHLHADKIGGL